MRKTIHQARLSEDIARALAEILEFETKDPVVQEAHPTVTRVELSGDARWAVVHVELDSTAEIGKVSEALARDRGFLRTQLAQRLRVRRVPDLRFEVDWPRKANPSKESL